MEVSGQLRDSAALPQGKSPWYPLDTRLGGPQGRSSCSGEEKNSQPVPGLEPLIIPPIAHRCTTELFRLPSTLLLVYKMTTSQTDRLFKVECEECLEKILARRAQFLYR
jgi:hypothetical protein